MSSAVVGNVAGYLKMTCFSATHYAGIASQMAAAHRLSSAVQQRAEFFRHYINKTGLRQ